LQLIIRKRFYWVFPSSHHEEIARCNDDAYLARDSLCPGGKLANVFFGWELGGGMGHLMRIAPLAKSLRARGHDVVVASRSLRHVSQLLSGSGVKYLQAPALSEAVQDMFQMPASFAHILHNIGFGDELILDALADAWRNLFQLIQPNLIVLDHSPTALLAARGGDARTVVLGTGFTIPPDLYPFPELRPESPHGLARLRQDEDRLLDRVNQHLAARGQSPLSHLGRLFADVDEQFLTTFQELDHYPLRSGGNYWGPINAWGAGGKAPDWPPGEGPRVFAYLKPCPPLMSVLGALAESKCRTVVYGDCLSDSIREKYASSILKFEHKRVDIHRAAQQCDLAITNGTFATTTMMLMAGKPLLLLPIFREQGMLAEIVERLGAGVNAAGSRQADAAKSLQHLLGNTAKYHTAAAQIAGRFSGFNPESQNEKLVNRLEHLLTPLRITTRLDDN
jgi:UDP:flavonoid glycosyltransferase YjiC (YdhE family)